MFRIFCLFSRQLRPRYLFSPYIVSQKCLLQLKFSVIIFFAILFFRHVWCRTCILHPTSEINEPRHMLRINEKRNLLTVLLDWFGELGWLLAPHVGCCLSAWAKARACSFWARLGAAPGPLPRLAHLASSLGRNAKPIAAWAGHPAGPCALTGCSPRTPTGNLYIFRKKLC